MADLFTTFAPPTVTAPANGQAGAGVQYLPAPLFDFEVGDFVRDSTGHFVMADGYQAWAQRQIKIILTRRQSSQFYAPAYGTNLERDFRQDTRAHREAAITADIAAACKRDPGTKDVDQFVFAYSRMGNRCDLSCRITPTVGPSRRVDVSDILRTVG